MTPLLWLRSFYWTRPPVSAKKCWTIHRILLCRILRVMAIGLIVFALLYRLIFF